MSFVPLFIVVVPVTVNAPESVISPPDVTSSSPVTVLVPSAIASLSTIITSLPVTLMVLKSFPEVSSRTSPLAPDSLALKVATRLAPLTVMIPLFLMVPPALIVRLPVTVDVPIVRPLLSFRVKFRAEVTLRKLRSLALLVNEALPVPRSKVVVPPTASLALLPLTMLSFGVTTVRLPAAVIFVAILKLSAVVPHEPLAIMVMLPKLASRLTVLLPNHTPLSPVVPSPVPFIMIKRDEILVPANETPADNCPLPAKPPVPVIFIEPDVADVDEILTPEDESTPMENPVVAVPPVPVIFMEPIVDEILTPECRSTP